MCFLLFVSLEGGDIVTTPILWPLTSPAASFVQRGISQYVKKRKLDPIESYIPPILAAKLELQLAKAGLAENLEEARQLLRTGPFDGVRDNGDQATPFQIVPTGLP